MYESNTCLYKNAINRYKYKMHIPLCIYDLMTSVARTAVLFDSVLAIFDLCTKQRLRGREIKVNVIGISLP